MPAILVVATRGQCVETRHQIVAVRTHRDGKVERFGEASLAFPVRSIVKPIQAVALLRSEAGIGLSQERIAIAASSHNGQSVHVATVLQWLDDLGLIEDDLLCPAAVPLVDVHADEYRRDGRAPRRAVHNCSGKHAGFLAQSLAAGSSSRDYLSVGGTVQRGVMAILGDACRHRITADMIAGDGCGAPVACLSLEAVSQGLLSLCPGGDNEQEGGLILGAMRSHSFLVAGDYRFDTRVVGALQGTCVSKVGADGLHVAVLPDTGIALAVKALDGSRRAAEVALAHLLIETTDASVEDLSSIVDMSVRDDAGVIVGELQVRVDVA
ncbi:MAG: asparaginase [Actinomycetota bacterium]